MHSSLQIAQVPRPASLGKVPRPHVALARAFLDNPYGSHGEALQALLNRMRATPVAGKLVVVVVEPDRAWCLARLPLRRGGQLEVLDGRFTDLSAAERAAFLIRWAELDGEEFAFGA